MVLPTAIEKSLVDIGKAISPITVEWLMKKVPRAGEILSPESLWERMRVAVRDENYYHRRESNDGRGIESNVLEYSCDGKNCYLGQHNRFPGGFVQPVVSTVPVARYVREGRVRPAQYFYWAGISVPFSSPWSIGKTEILPQPLAMLSAGFQILSIDFDDPSQHLIKMFLQGPNPKFEAVKNVTLEQAIQEFRRFETDEKQISEFSKRFEHFKKLSPLKRYAFYLNPLQAYAVIHFEEYDHQDKLEIRATNSDFRPMQRNPDVWLPRRIITQRYSLPGYYDNTGEPRYTESFDVNFVSEDEIPDDLFNLTLKYDKPRTQLVTFGDDSCGGNISATR